MLIKKINEIIVFGLNSCKFCKLQLNSLQDCFKKDKIVYLDLENNKEALNLAQELNLEYTPSIVVLGKSGIIVKKNGFIATDQLFYEINKTIPVKYENFKNLKLKKYSDIIVSFNPEIFKKNIKIETYDQEKSIDANVNSIKKINRNKFIENFGEESFENYKRTTGKDYAFVLNVEPKRL